MDRCPIVEPEGIRTPDLSRTRRATNCATAPRCGRNCNTASAAATNRSRRAAGVTRGRREGLLARVDPPDLHGRNVVGRQWRGRGGPHDTVRLGGPGLLQHCPALAVDDPDGVLAQAPSATEPSGILSAYWHSTRKLRPRPLRNDVEHRGHRRLRHGREGHAHRPGSGRHRRRTGRRPRPSDSAYPPSPPTTSAAAATAGTSTCCPSAGAPAAARA